MSPFLLGTVAEESMGVMTALAGLIGACIAAYKLLKPSPAAAVPVEDEPEPEPEHKPFKSVHRDDHDEEYEDHIKDLRESLANCRETVRNLRRRLDRATGIGDEPPKDDPDWLSGR